MNIVIEQIIGMCPVQGYGSIDGHPFYFRSRGAHWQFGATAPGNDPMDALDASHCFSREEVYGTWPDAGYMPEVEARAIIERCAREYIEHLSMDKPGGKP